MDTLTSSSSSSASVFEASTRNPQAAVGISVAEVAKLLAKYKDSQDVLDRMNLLTEVEGLRRFVLVRGALVRALREPAPGSDTTLGQDLVRTLQEMIGDAPEVSRSCSLQGARNMERDARRAVASLGFIGSLDPSFV